MSCGAALHVEYARLETLLAGSPADHERLLGVAAFAPARPAFVSGDLPLAWVATPPLGGAPALCELWGARGPITAGRTGLVQYRTDGEVVFGCVSLGEQDVAAPDRTAALVRATGDIYASVFACLAELDCPHILRIWNYLPEINRELDGVERYRSFNGARQTAFHAFRRATRGNVPAACALGSAAGSGLVVYFIASRTAATPIENPRQVPAYDYPREYGASSPTFSRAALAGSDGDTLLFVSGTASIVGHRTQHAGDVRAQTRETVQNLETLVAQANLAAGREAFSTRALRYKAYLRNAADLAVVAAEVDTALKPGRPVVYLLADICRSDLLVEIEAVGSSDASGR